jgi:16S rRNA (cytidine1402-2'-O)-methyltransferase
LSASGLSASRFCFEGFPPRKSSARRALFESLVHERHTLIFYESVHRIEETLRDAEAVFPAERRLVIARELTKLYETIHSTTVGQALAILELQPEMRRGEFVVLIDGSPPEPESQALTAEHRRILEILLSECSVKTAVSLAVKVTGGRRDQFYRAALRLNPQDN